MRTIDETALLRFAAGELGADEEAVFLARCEAAPEAWRDAVLAIAEHRRVVEALGELAREESVGRPAASRPRPRARLATAALVAASLLAGAAAGFLVRAGMLDNRRPAPVAVAPPPPTPAERAPAEPPPIPAEVLQLPPLIPDVQRTVLRDHGFHVVEEPTLYVITAENGTRWAVPTQRATLHYVKQ